MTESTPDSTCDDHNAPAQKLFYPKAIWFVIGFKALERFCIHGFKTTLVLYLTSQLGFSENSATIIYHLHGVIMYFTGILGAIICDSWLGKFRTILYMHLLSTVGVLMFVITAAEQLNLPFRDELTVLAIIILSYGNGSLKPCILAFGADQFHLPEQTEHMNRYFAHFYLVLKVSGVASSLLTPVVRSDIPSIGEADGYLLAFALVLVMNVGALVLFLFGIPYYKTIPVTKNMLVRVAKCIKSAVLGKTRSVQCETDTRHWLEFASAKYNSKLVHDTKALLNVLSILALLPMYWALNEQSSSLFPLQATRMNGDLGFYTIKPDQLQLVMQLLVMLLIPLCDLIIYPILALVGVRTVFQRIALGGFLSVVAFLIAGILDMHIVDSTEQLHMMWILPQYILLALVEAIVGVLGMVFANTAGPASLRTVLQASFLASHGLGNMYDILIFSVNSFTVQAHLFFFFAGLMLVNTIVFICMTVRYKSVDPPSDGPGKLN